MSNQSNSKAGGAKQPPRAKTKNKLFALFTAALTENFSRADIAIYAALIEFSNDRAGYAWPSLDLLAEVTELDKRTVRKSLRRMEDAGAFVSQFGGGRKKTNKYWLGLASYDESPFSARIKDALNKRGPTRPPSEEAIEQERGADHAERGADHAENGGQSTPRNLLNKPTYINPSADAARFGNAHRMQNRSIASFVCQTEREWKSGKLRSDQAIKVLEDLCSIAQQDDELEAERHAERVIVDIELAEGAL